MAALPAVSGAKAKTIGATITAIKAVIASATRQIVNVSATIACLIPLRGGVAAISFNPPIKPATPARAAQRASPIDTALAQPKVWPPALRRRSICPARISDDVAKKAQEIALKVSDKIQQVGLLAVEMFQTQDDEILVNEVAPRPHNSGHYSIEASYTNQFEQHIRAILDLPLGKTDSKVAGIMVNLVGAENHTGNVVYENIAEIMAMDGVTPHIYGKKQTRPFRKMGHVTIVNEDISEARRIAQEVKERIKVISK